MPFLVYESKGNGAQIKNNINNQNKMLLPSSYFDTHKNLTNSKMPFVRNNNNKTKQRDKHMVFNNNPPPPLATQQALAMMMDYDLGNELVLNNSNAYYKSKLVNADRRR
jgi:hypothetical protein